MQGTGRLGQALKTLLGIWMAGVIFAALVWSPPLQGLGEAGRIFYFHVPCAWVGTLAYLMAAVSAAIYLSGHKLEWDCRSAAAARVGLLFTVLATVSGAVWAQASWGRWWNWDPRQRAIFVVLLVYGAYFALRSSIEQPERRAAVSAVYALIALAAAVFLVFIAPRLPGIESLHPSPVLPSPNEHGSIQPRILMVLMASLAGFTGLFAWMWRIQTAIERLTLRRQHYLE